MGRNYQPPYKGSPAVVGLVADIAEIVGRHSMMIDGARVPVLRRQNRIRTIHASLAIEHNSLTLDQVTSIIDGKRVLGHPREIQEVRNALAAYESMNSWDPTSGDDLLAAHGLLMNALIDQAGMFRTGGVGVFEGSSLVHMAPPAGRVSALMDDLLAWLKNPGHHPLVAGCLFHAELEFIHPFADGNGRMGRLWQTLILSRWNPVMAFLPVETVIHAGQQDYYGALGLAAGTGDATPFVEYMLGAMLVALREATATDQVTDQVTEQIRRLLFALLSGPLGVAGLLAALELSHRPTLRANYLAPAISLGLVEPTQPESPRSPTQKYRLTAEGRRLTQAMR
ncbi:MAG TPA: Fic family protein [Myxococcota bacterium]|nr:Fic family protein [Myxococcota bacterium]